jgi:hypothetical protein
MRVLLTTLACGLLGLASFAGFSRAMHPAFSPMPVPTPSPGHQVKNAQYVTFCDCLIDNGPEALEAHFTNDGTYEFAWLTDVDEMNKNHCYYQAVKNLAKVQARFYFAEAGLTGTIVPGGNMRATTTMASEPKTPAAYFTLYAGADQKRALSVRLYQPDVKSRQAAFVKGPRTGGVPPVVGVPPDPNFNTPIDSEFYAELAVDDQSTPLIVHLQLSSVVVGGGRGQYGYVYRARNLGNKDVSISWRSLDGSTELPFQEVFNHFSNVIESHVESTRNVRSKKPARMIFGVVEVKHKGVVIATAPAPAFLPVV